MSVFLSLQCWTSAKSKITIKSGTYHENRRATLQTPKNHNPCKSYDDSDDEICDNNEDKFEENVDEENFEENFRKSRKNKFNLYKMNEKSNK